MVSAGYLSNSFKCYLWFMPTHFISVYCGLWFVPAQTLSLSFHRKKIVICDLCQHILVICLSYYRKNCNMFIVKIVITYTKELYQKFCICWFPDEPNRNEISVVLLANRLLASCFQCGKNFSRVCLVCKKLAWWSGHNM